MYGLYARNGDCKGRFGTLADAMAHTGLPPAEWYACPFHAYRWRDEGACWAIWLVSVG